MQQVLLIMDSSGGGLPQMAITGVREAKNGPPKAIFDPHIW